MFEHRLRSPGVSFCLSYLGTAWEYIGGRLSCDTIASLGSICREFSLTPGRRELKFDRAEVISSPCEGVWGELTWYAEIGDWQSSILVE